MSSLPLTKSKKSRNVNSSVFTGYTEVKYPQKNKSAEGNPRDKQVTNQTGDENLSENLACPASLKPFERTQKSSLPLRNSKKPHDINSNAFTGYTEVKYPKKNKSTEGNMRDKQVTNQTGGENSSENLACPASLKPFVEFLWKYAQNTIYKDHYLTQSQVDKGR